MMEKLFIGDIKIPCAGEKFMEPIGDKFVPLIETDTTKDTEAMREKKEMTKEMSPEKELTTVGEREEDKVIGVELEEKKRRLRPPKMIALDSTAESITWHLSEAEPKLEISKYQVRGERLMTIRMTLILARCPAGMISPPTTRETCPAAW